jgi:hypothetical protein
MTTSGNTKFGSRTGTRHPCLPTLLALLPLLGAMAAPASAQRIFTAGETGAYHKDFCPALSRELGNVGAANYACTASTGTRDNMERVRSNPRDFGYGQLDVYTLETQQLAMGNALEIVRQDDLKECVFAVTKSKDVTSFGELSALSPSMRVFLPPPQSGSAGTFKMLQSIDRNGLGRAGRVTNSPSVDEAIRAALLTDDGVAFFVQFPDPENERFKQVRDLGGHFVPIVDRSILAKTISGQNVYSTQETRVQNGRWLEGGIRVNTVCTPLVLFTGNPERIRDATEKRQQTETIRGIRDLPLDTLIPRQSSFRAATARARELTQDGRERLFAYSARTRDRALPFIERMIERAAPRY